MSTNTDSKEPKEPNGHNITTPTASTSMSIDNAPSNSNEPSTDNQLMQHIIEHLRYKGLDNIAKELESKTELKTDNNNKNGHTITNRKRSFSEMNGNKITNESSSYLTQIYNNFEHKSNSNTNTNNNTNNNKHFVSDEQVMSSADFSLQSFGEYSQLFVHSNKSHISCITFSNNGLFNCIGCNDGTIRIFDVNKLHQSRNFNSLIKKYDSNSYSDIHRPLISTLNSGFMHDTSSQYRINEIDFHPNLESCQQLVSCCSHGINFYEFKKQNRKSPIQTIRECFNISTVQYHPSGKYIIVGGESFYIRIYDIEKSQGYIANKNNNKDYNINQIRYSYGGGNIFASCSDGGDIRLYDGRSLCVVNTLKKFHKNQSITSIRFSKNCKYLLSYGADNIIRLCDLRVGKECMNYRNNKQINKNKNIKENKENNNNLNGQACFTYNDEHILCYSQISNRIFVYDTNSGHRISKFKDHISSNNDNYISYLATSPTEPAFMSSSANDNKNRFYATIKQMVDMNQNTNQNISQNITNQKKP